MRSRSRELFMALIAMGFITLAYLFVQVVYRRVPPASGFYGHSMGILGFILMLMTETLYTLRKRSHNARWGRMASWLEFHIFTGLVGPYLVLLHSAWSFHGLAGVLMLLTVMIVISGFIGRYIYTSIPRAPSGEELSIEELEAKVSQTEIELARLEKNLKYERKSFVSIESMPANAAGLMMIQIGVDLPEVSPEKLVSRKKDQELRNHEDGLNELRKRRERLKRRIASLASARRLFAIWHTVHIPIGLTLFLMAFVHIGAAIYYSTLLK